MPANQEWQWTAFAILGMFIQRRQVPFKLFFLNKWLFKNGFAWKVTKKCSGCIIACFGCCLGHISKCFCVFFQIVLYKKSVWGASFFFASLRVHSHIFGCCLNFVFVFSLYLSLYLSCICLCLCICHCICASLRVYSHIFGCCLGQLPTSQLCITSILTGFPKVVIWISFTISPIFVLYKWYYTNYRFPFVVIWICFTIFLIFVLYKCQNLLVDCKVYFFPIPI